MPVQIGTTVHDFSNPTGLLSDCHRRIEMFLGSLEAVAKVIDRPLTQDTAGALSAALRYFREAAPKHIADEEESLFPRLRRMNDPEIRSAIAKLEELEKDHQWAADMHAEVDRLGRQYLSHGHVTPGEAADFSKAVTSLRSMYQVHISVEDDLVFPTAARLMSKGDQASIAGEMAARRKVPLVTEISKP